MDFYGRNDITLGSFLERYCFRTTFTCPSQTCSTSMLQHVRRFVHFPGCVQVTLQLVDGVGSLPSNDHILMWSCCSLCSVVRMLKNFLADKPHCKKNNLRSLSSAGISCYSNVTRYLGIILWKVFRATVLWRHVLS